MVSVGLEIGQMIAACSNATGVQCDIYPSIIQGLELEVRHLLFLNHAAFNSSYPASRDNDNSGGTSNVNSDGNGNENEDNGNESNNDETGNESR